MIGNPNGEKKANNSSDEINMSHYIIYGKDDCPHTQKARQDFLKLHKSFIYVNVESNAHGLEMLLKYTDGKYMVPVIVDVDEERAEIGYTGD